MSKLYYLFSEISSKEKINEKEFREAIYICDDKEFIENADFQTGVYPMGTFLSKTIKLLTPWAEQGYSPYKWKESISKGLDCVSEKDSSFSNLIQDDPVADTVFRALFIYPESIQPRRRSDEFYEMLAYYLKYVELCQEQDGKFSSIKELNFLINQVNDCFSKHSTYVTYRLNKQNLSSKNEIENFLSNTNFISSTFAPPLKKPVFKQLFPSIYQTSASLRNIRETKWGKLKTPLEIFYITDAIDLILASLYCIFQQKYFLRKCPYCKGLFITYDKRRKHCPNMTDESKSCSNKQKLKRQLEREHSGSAYLEKSLRAMSEQKYGSTHPKHRDFLNNCQKWRDDIKAEIETEENYVIWLKGHYAYKYKDELPPKD